jgi:general secretion pathway protein L
MEHIYFHGGWGGAMEATKTMSSDLPPPSGVTFLRGEDVLLLAVPMPQMTAAQRRVAVSYAIEDQIAAPLDDVAVILGPELPAVSDASAGWLVAVISRDVLAKVGVQRTRLIPDVLALPTPAPGEWSVWAGDMRILVRVPDGTGFACTDDGFDVYHLAAGRPAIALFGGVLPTAYTIARQNALPARMEPWLDRFNLRQGTAATTGKTRKALRRIGVLMLAAGMAHAAIAATDIMLLSQYRDEQRSTVADALVSIGLTPTPDVETALTAALAQGDTGTAPQLLPLLTQVFGAVGGQTGRVSLRDLRFAGDQGTVTVTVEAPDLTTLQEVETALAGAGLGVSAGAATTGNGQAEQQLTITGGGP